MDTRWSMTAHDAAELTNDGRMVYLLVRKSIAVHRESCTMVGWKIWMPALGLAQALSSDVNRACYLSAIRLRFVKSMADGGIQFPNA